MSSSRVDLRLIVDGDAAARPPASPQCDLARSPAVAQAAVAFGVLGHRVGLVGGLCLGFGLAFGLDVVGLRLLVFGGLRGLCGLPALRGLSGFFAVGLVGALAAAAALLLGLRLER